MLEHLIVAVFMLFAVVGFVEVVKSVWIFFLSTHELKGRLIIPLKGEIDDVEIKLRSICSRIKWDNNCFFSEIVIVDEGIEPHTKAICEMLCEDYNEISIKNEMSIL